MFVSHKQTRKAAIAQSYSFRADSLNDFYDFAKSFIQVYTLYSKSNIIQSVLFFITISL